MFRHALDGRLRGFEGKEEDRRGVEVGRGEGR